MTPITFQHGPVTITLAGLPDSVDPRSVELSLSLHSSYYPAEIRAAFDRFAECYRDLGGPDTFEAPAASDTFARSYAEPVRGVRSAMFLHPPQTRVVEAREALLSVLGADPDEEPTQGAGVASGAVDAPCERLQPGEAESACEA